MKGYTGTERVGHRVSTSMDSGDIRVAVVIPAYRVVGQIASVISRIGSDVWRIYVVDDNCPDGTGDYVQTHCDDPRVVVLRNKVNLGVGGAVMTGYKAALADGAEILVKLDGDGQMDPALISAFVNPISSGWADYTKGNRFFDLDDVREMPKLRLFGNAVLSFLSKLSSGYWDVFDPTNGYTAIHAAVARRLPMQRISRRYFFETDMLFHLNILRAVVYDVPMEAKYGDEVSGLKTRSAVPEFLFKHIRNFLRRIFYNYYLRDVSAASFELPLGLVALLGGGGFGAYHWTLYASHNLPAPTGTVVLPVMLILIGVQLLLAFLSYDVASVPHRPIHVMSRDVK